MQTEPCEPECRSSVGSKAKHARPTLLRLQGITEKDQEMTCLEEIREEEDFEERLAFQGTDLSDLKRIELRERWKWMAKEEKLKERQASKTARFTKELEGKEAKKEAYLARRTQERVIGGENTLRRSQDRREKLRPWRDPQTRRWLEAPLSVKTPLIDAFARVTSSLHCPRRRDGTVLRSRPSETENAEDHVSHKTFAALEKRLARCWTENVPEPTRKPSRTMLRIADDIDRVYEAIKKENSTREAHIDERMRPATKPHEHNDCPSGSAAQCHADGVGDEDATTESIAFLRRLVRGRLVRAAFLTVD